MIPTAQDLMQTSVICVSPESSLLDVHRLFLEEEISGAPVTDNAGTLLGVISTTDLVRAVEEEHETVFMRADYFRDTLAYSGPDWSGSPEDLQDRMLNRRVEEAMTHGVVFVAPETPAPEVARVIRENRIHRAFVVEDGRMVGVISAFDVLRLVEEWKTP
jgi:CBS domain-containing protein